MRGRRSEPRVKIGRLFPDLLATLGGVASSEAGFVRTLKRLVALSGARAGALRFRPGEAAPVDLVVGARPGSALDGWLRARLEPPRRGVRLGKPAPTPPGPKGRDPGGAPATPGGPAPPQDAPVPPGARGASRP